MAEIPPISGSNQPLGQPIPDKVRRRRDKYSQNESISKTSDLEKIESHVAKLSSSDDVRPEMVELGKQLANSKDFPSSENLDKLAEALLSPLEDLLDEEI